jgi:hypothetical protein
MPQDAVVCDVKKRREIVSPNPRWRVCKKTDGRRAQCNNIKKWWEIVMASPDARWQLCEKTNGRK